MLPPRLRHGRKINIEVTVYSFTWPMYKVNGGTHPVDIHEYVVQRQKGVALGYELRPRTEVLVSTARRRPDSAGHRHLKRRLRAMLGLGTEATARAAIQGIAAAQVSRKEQALGITPEKLCGHAVCSDHFWASRKQPLRSGCVTDWRFVPRCNTSLPKTKWPAPL